jgi:hypothetical protein
MGNLLLAVAIDLGDGDLGEPVLGEEGGVPASG